MSSSENPEFHVDLSFSAKDTHKTFLIASIVAVVSVAFIILTVTTDLAAHLLPMKDDYLQILIPIASDGAEPVALKTLDQEIKENTITVKGSVANRTDYTISNIVAVLNLQETTSRFPQTVEIPVEPADLSPQQAGTFTTTTTLHEKPIGYLIKFRLGDGPFLPHKDERPPVVVVPGQ